jgi:hypothetical protein
MPYSDLCVTCEAKKKWDEKIQLCLPLFDFPCFIGLPSNLFPMEHLKEFLDR